MPRSRLVSMSVAAIVTIIAGIVTGFIVVPQHAAQHRTAMAKKPRCVPYPLIAPMQICGKDVIYTNPDGSRVNMGSAEALFQPHTGLRPAVRP